MTQIIEFSNMSASYKNQNDAVFSNLTASISQGEFVLIKGSNGSGKSTLLSIISKLEHSNLQVTYENLKLTDEVGIVLQDPSVQFLTFSVKEELSTKLSYQKVDRSTRKYEVEKILTQFNEMHLSEQNPSRISSGQQQKILILANIIDNPQVILLDEPFTFLDYHNIEQMIKYLVQLKGRGYTIILTTHLDILDHRVDQIIHLDTFEEEEKVITSIELDVDRNYRYSINGEIGYDQSLFHINKEFSDHGIYSIQGLNGSGKTCMLLTLARITDLESGTMYFPDNVIMIPQRVNYFFTAAKVSDELVGLEIPKWVTSHLDKSPFQLSVGQQRVLAIYIAIKRFDIILIDEPFQSVDTKISKFLIELFNEVKLEKLIIFTTNRQLSSLGFNLPDNCIIEIGDKS